MFKKDEMWKRGKNWDEGIDGKIEKQESGG